MTVIELPVVMAIMMPILFMMMTTQDAVSNTLAVNDRRADTGDHARRVARRLSKMLRSGLKSSLLVKATPSDVERSKAAENVRFNADPEGIPIYVPTVHEWISPRENELRTTLQFVSADGVLAMNAAARTQPRILEFSIDANEKSNGADDDGDGLVDEGTLTLRYEGMEIPILDGIESCTFEVDGGNLVMRILVARRDQTRTVHRAMITQTVFLRNN